MDSSVPTVKISHHADPQGIGRPYGEQNTVHTVHLHGMRTQFLIDHIVNAGVEFLRVFFCDLRCKIVGVLHLFQRSVLVLHYILVIRNLFPRQQSREIAFFIGQIHLITHIPLSKLQTHALGTGLKSLHEYGVSHHMGAQRRMRIIGLRVNDSLNHRPVHQFI